VTEKKGLKCWFFGCQAPFSSPACFLITRLVSKYEKVKKKNYENVRETKLN
jgi:hypothetical protein